MSSEPEVTIQVQYPVGGQKDPLVRVLSESLDNKHVFIEHHAIAIRALDLQLVIDATAVYFFEKFVLDPLLDPISERWSNAVKSLIRPPAFSLIVRVNGIDKIELPRDVDDAILPMVWRTVHKAVKILEAEKRLDNTSQKVRISYEKGKPRAVCYEGNRPTREILLDEGKTKGILEQ